MVEGFLDGIAGLVSNAKSAPGDKILESHIGQLGQVAQLEQLIAQPILELLLPADADLKPAEIRMIDGQILADVANALAMGAVGITQVGASVGSAAFSA
jgi:hypothetical protein